MASHLQYALFDVWYALSHSISPELLWSLHLPLNGVLPPQYGGVGGGDGAGGVGGGDDAGDYGLEST